ncbi:MAG: phenylacetate--CoA ligase [Actinomycetota bacterium]
MLWDEKHEAMSREDLERLQFARLKDTLERVYGNVPFYKAQFDEAGVKPDDIKNLADLTKVPFTTKQDLRDNYPFKLFAVPRDDVVRVHASSGTTGQVTVVGYTRKDIDEWAGLIARCLVSCGAGKSDTMQIAYGYGLFTGGLGLHYGVEKLGGMAIPMSGGNTQRQIKVMQDFAATVLCCTPSYALHLAEAAAEMGVDIRKLPLKIGVFGAEPWSESMRKQAEEKMGIDAFDIYGLSEVLGPGVSCECSAKNGLHVFEDHFIPEIVNPETGERMPEGEPGELVFTSLMKEATPVIRYRSKDITKLSHEPCTCGRTHARMARVFGRSDDMLIIRGVNFFPSQVEDILVAIEGVEPHYQIVVDRSGVMDDVEVQVEVAPDIFSDEIKVLERLEKKISAAIRDELGIGVTIKLVEPKSIQRSEGKAKRVVDKRDLKK